MSPEYPYVLTRGTTPSQETRHARGERVQRGNRSRFEIPGEGLRLLRLSDDSITGHAIHDRVAHPDEDGRDPYEDRHGEALELPPIGWQLFILGSSQHDSKAFR